MTKTVLIVGGGPCGLLTAYFLAKRVNDVGKPSYPKILVVERGENLCEIDPLKRQGRGNYGVVLSYRALKALEKVGLKNHLISKGILYNRLQNCILYDDLPNGLLSITPDYKLSMDRDGVVRALIQVIERDFSQQVTLIFSKAFGEADYQAKVAYLVPSQFYKGPKLGIDKLNVETLPFDILIGADGAHSRVVDNLRHEVYGIQFKQEFSPEPFISTFIPFEEFELIGIKVDRVTMYTVQSSKKNANLVIIPNQSGMNVSLIPSCQLHHRSSGSRSVPETACFHTFETPAEMDAYLVTSFPKLGSLLNQYMTPHVFPNHLDKRLPQLFYVTAEVSQYHHPSCPVVVLGDAVHSMPPYIGQGINAAFEDVDILDSLLDEYEDDWKVIPPLFTKVRQPQGKAILELNRKYVRTNFTFNLALRLFMDFLRNLLSRHLPKGWVQPPVIHLLSQTSIPYADLLGIRERQFLIGCLLLSILPFLLLSMVLYYLC